MNKIVKNVFDNLIMPVKDDSVNVTIVIASGNVYDNVKVDDIDYEDIYDNIDDYEYPYNHVNRSEL